jgi:ketosteroid isomerase-like protein
MSQANVEIVRCLLHAFVQGDYEASTKDIGAEVVLWSDPRANMETQQVQGREAVTASIGRFVSSFDDYWCAEPDELIDAGDWVVVVMRSGGRGRTSGVPVTQTWTVAYELADRKVVRIEFHPTREKALEAAGLLE